VGVGNDACLLDYVSCERLFQPKLEGRPVVVLSNNDGNVIARDELAKSLGIPMGAPYFQYKTLIRAHRVHVFSSNFGLYGDFSRRLGQIIAQFVPNFEVYSIDEVFASVSGLSPDVTGFALDLARTIRQWIGIPVSIGLGPTKTLAKLATRRVKKGLSPFGPALDWATLQNPESVLAAVPVEDVWGIAGRWGQRLRALGIEHAQALKEAEPKWLRREFGVVMERIAWELRGVSCLPLEAVPPPRKQIMVSRSFGRKLTDLADLRAAVAGFAARAGEKLRAQELAAQALGVFIQTSPFDTAQPPYANAITLAFERPSQHSGYLIGRAVRGLERIYRPGLHYQRAGVMLLDLAPAGLEQGVLFGTRGVDPLRTALLMAALDRINRLYGRGTLRYASEAVSDRWRMRARLKSPAYTTRWEELPVVKAG
jgi:DNA polymerase V